MARFTGMIGFSIDKEVRPGIFKEVYVERKYKGLLTRKSRSWDNSEYLNDTLSLQNELSIISDDFINRHFGAMRYVRLMGQAFEITSATIDVDQHRITLSLGGIFNVPESDTNSEGYTS